MTTVPGRPVGSSGGTDVFPGRTGEKHVSVFKGSEPCGSKCPFVYLSSSFPDTEPAVSSSETPEQR